MPLVRYSSRIMGVGGGGRSLPVRDSGKLSWKRWHLRCTLENGLETQINPYGRTGGKRIRHGPEQKLLKVTMHMKNSKRFRLTAVYNA